MLETDVIGNKDWARGFLNEEDVQHLEAFDSDMKVRHLQRDSGPGMTSTYESLVEENPAEIPLRCEHGIPVYRKCPMCRSHLE